MVFTILEYGSHQGINVLLGNIEGTEKKKPVLSFFNFYSTW